MPSFDTPVIRATQDEQLVECYNKIAATTLRPSATSML